MQKKKVQKDNPPKQNTNKNANKIQMRTASCQRGARSLPPRLIKWRSSSGSGYIYLFIYLFIYWCLP